MENDTVYTADLHGNEAQYRTLVDYVLKIKPKIVIIGGDLPPKDGYKDVNDYPVMQRAFLTERLPFFISQIKEQLPDTQVHMIPGNDDCSINDDVLDYHPSLFTNIDGKRAAIPGGLEIVGYSIVPITPFGIKDREKFDLTNVSADVARRYAALQNATYALKGVKSNRDGWREFSFSDKDKADSIQRDLGNELFTINPKNTIYVFHTPPNDTSLDITGIGMHVGSLAVRQFIEKHQPLLTLHGHIHETVDMSGVYKEQIGKSWIMSAGNDNLDDYLAILVFDSQNPSGAERIKIPCTKFGKMLGRSF